ncbi:MAG: glycosyltransferase family 2 protein [Verrucomicrobiaceae bacterium]|nr:glycosyltransferase family 2 protein [Verrucomicrobiaceae bacterium]
MPYVSVIIPTLNRAGPLANVVRYFLEQEPYRDFELIIVDQSDEKNAELESLAVNSHVPLRYFHVDFRQTTRARNLGVKNASGELIVFSEDDVEPWMGILGVYVRHFEDPNAMAATGPVLLPSQKLRSRPEVSESELNRLLTLRSMAFDLDFGFKAVYAAGGNSAYRSEAIRRVGGFDQNYVGNAWGEEFEFCFRVRHGVGSIDYLPAAGVIHLVYSTGGSRNAKPAPYVTDFVRNSIYTDVRTHASWSARLMTLWRCLRRLVWNRQNLASGEWLTLLLPYLKGIWVGTRVSLGPPNLPQSI